MNIYKTIGGLLTVALLATACGGGAGGGPGDNGGPPDGSGGALVVDSRLDLRVLRIDGTFESAQLPTGGSVLSVLNPADGNLYLARHTMADPFTVRAYHPARLTAIGETFEWPETSNSMSLSGLAFSPDGRYAAAVVGEVRDDYLHVVDLSTGEPQQLLTGFAGVIGNSLVWLNNSELAFVMDVSGVSDEEVADYEGAIVSIDVVQAADGPEADIGLIARFDAANWVDTDSVTGLTLNAAGDELLYSLEGDVYVKEAPFRIDGSAPHQLTTGATPHVSAVFSPDGSEIAFVEYHEEFQSGIFVIPNHRGAVIEPADSQLITRTNVQRLVGWLP